MRTHFRCVVMVLGSVLGTSVAVAAQVVYQPVPCKNAFTQQQELEAGQKYSAEIFKQMPVLKDSDPMSVYVNGLGQRLAALAPGYQWPYNFHVVSSEEINAFALPGGAIFVNLATIQAAENEAQLAGVIAHEVSHVALRHSTCNMTRQQKKSLLYGLAALGGAMLGGDYGSLAAQGVGAIASMDFLRMGRDAEKQADLLGVQIMYDAGFDPRGMPQFFEVIQGKYGNGSAQFLSDHPNPGNRMEYVNAEIQQLPRRQNGIRASREFTAMKARAAELKPLSAAEVKAGAWKSSGQFQLAPGPMDEQK